MVSAVISRVRNNRFYAAVAWVAGGTAAAQIITVLTTPVITRLYSPADYGVLSMFVAILAVLQPLSTLTYSVAIPLAEDERLAYSVLKLCFLITLILSILLAAIIPVFGARIAAHFSVAHAAPYLWLLPICLFGAGLYEALSSWAIRRKFFTTIAHTKLSQGGSAATLKIGLGWLGVRPLGLLLGLLASSAAGCGSIASKLLKEEPHILTRYSWRAVADAAKRFYRFPLLRSWSRLLLSLNGKLPVFFVAALFGVEVVGQFGLAYSMINLPIVLVGSSVAKVYYAEIARYGRSQPAEIRRLTMSVMRKMLLVGLLPIGPIIVAGPPLFSLIFGPQWHDAGIYARWLSVVILGKFVSMPVMHCLDVFERQGMQVMLNVIRMVLITAVFMACKVLAVSAFATIAAYGVGLVTYSAVAILIILSVVHHEAR